MKRNYRHVAIAATAALLACTAANAQQDAANEQRNAWRDSLAYDEYLAGQALRASELIGAKVQNEQGEDLGEVKDLIVSRQDDVVEAVIGIGGILGVGEKQISIPYERLRVSADGQTLFLGMTREQLEAAPEFEEPRRQTAAGRSAAAGAIGERSAADRAGDRSAADRAEEQRQAQAAQRREDAERQAQQPAQADDPVVVMDSSDRRATELIGMTVVDNRGQQVGEIDDLVVSATSGKIEAVLAVGGVLGIGQKLVSLPLDELEIPAESNAEQPGQDGENTVRINMTSDELLESRPEFRYSDEERTAGVR